MWLKGNNWKRGNGEINWRGDCSTGRKVEIKITARIKCIVEAYLERQEWVVKTQINRFIKINSKEQKLVTWFIEQAKHGNQKNWIVPKIRFRSEITREKELL